MIPSRIWIKNVQYEIVYQKTIDRENDLGYCDDKTKHLYIKTGLDKRTELDAFLHEFFHALTHQYKIRIGHTNLDKLATALADVILLNKLDK